MSYAVEHFRVGAERAGRTPADLDLGDSLLGAIAPDADVARRAGRVLAAFYIPSMPPALLERHGIDPEGRADQRAFAAGTSSERWRRRRTTSPTDIVAGTPDDWIGG